jgi:hypothetical protein
MRIAWNPKYGFCVTGEPKTRNPFASCEDEPMTKYPVSSKDCLALPSAWKSMQLPVALTPAVSTVKAVP